jgi:hypothetical protein
VFKKFKPHIAYEASLFTAVNETLYVFLTVKLFGRELVYSGETKPIS